MEAFPGKLALASSFRFGLAHVMIKRGKNCRDGHYAYIDRRGRIVFEYDGNG
jgi:hypothetical protein